jgi:hypothetical protein
MIIKYYIIWHSDLEYGIEEVETKASAEEWMEAKKKETPSTEFEVITGAKLVVNTLPSGYHWISNK